MKGNASIAVPSTTSIIIHPTILYCFSLLVRISVTLQATDPPMECPMITTFFSWKRSINCFKTSIVSVTNVSIEKSSMFYDFLEYPWPLMSKATNVPKFFTSLARVAKLRAEWPAPCMQKYKAPSWPALKVDVPWIVRYLHHQDRRVHQNRRPNSRVNSFF